jgi:hypothetical protein
MGEFYAKNWPQRRKKKEKLLDKTHLGPVFSVTVNSELIKSK